VGGGWQISAGDLAEVIGPAHFAFASLSSAWVLFDSRRRAGRLHAAFLALVTLLIPFVALPLYLAARLFARRADAATPPRSTDSADANAPLAPGEAGVADVPFSPDAAEEEARFETALPAEVDADEGARPRDAGSEGDEPPRSEEGREGEQGEGGEEGGADGWLGSLKAGWRGLALPVAYAAALLMLGGVYYALDRRDFDAHFARAKRARLRGDAARAAAEYRAALRLREDAHTRKLLGLELLRDGRAGEALEEIRAAARGAEPDDSLPFHEARALDALARREEAAESYRRFAAGPACAREPADPRCAAARERTGPP